MRTDNHADNGRALTHVLASPSNRSWQVLVLVRRILMLSLHRAQGLEAGEWSC